MAGMAAAVAAAASRDIEAERRGSIELGVLEAAAASAAEDDLGVAQQLDDERDSMARVQKEEEEWESQVVKAVAPAPSYSAASAKTPLGAQALLSLTTPVKNISAMRARSGASPMPVAALASPSPIDPELRAQIAVMQYSCDVRGKVSDALRKGGWLNAEDDIEDDLSRDSKRTWEGTPWPHLSQLKLKDTKEAENAWESIPWTLRLELVQAKHAEMHTNAPVTLELQSPPPPTPARRKEIMVKYSRLSKKALWQSRLQAGIARHQTWWLISGSKRAEIQHKLHMLTNLHYFKPLTKNNHINELPWYIIDPSGHFSVAWTFWMTLLLLYCMFTIPYFIAFDQSDGFRWADACIDCMFLIDIVLNFVTATVKSDHELQYQLEVRPRVLGKQYLRGWLFLDLLGTVPFTEIMRDSVQGADTYPRLIKVLRILRMLKLLRLSRFGQKAEFVKSLLKMHVGIFRGVKFLVFFITLAHIMANILVITATFASDEHVHPKSWLTQFSVFDDGIGMVPIGDSSKGTQYLMALYWSFTTIITLGYGDIYPVQTAEAGVCILNMIIGAAVFSFLVGNVASVLAAADSSRGIDSIRADLHYKYKLAPELKNRLQLWYESLKEVTGDLVPHWPDALGKLSRGLRNQLFDEVASEALRSSHLFPNNKRLQQALQLCMQRRVFLCRDTIYRCDDACRRLFFVLEGSVDLRLPTCSHRLLTLGKGAHFGEMAVVSQEQVMRYSVVASQVTVCLSLDFADIQRVLLDLNLELSIKKRAMDHDAMLEHCLQLSKKIFEARAADKRGNVAQDEANLRRDCSSLFPSTKDSQSGLTRVPSLHKTKDVAAVLAQTGTLKRGLEQLQTGELARIAEVESARKEVTHLIQTYESMMLEH